ncbi:MAG TPA: cytochrome P450, partial [Acidimicrobiales bacterium]|nr:cytochrome P450 [Acidimicrobiales bacterium]
MIAESPSGRGAASASLSGDPAYALFCEARLEDPYRLLEAMREEEPVHWSPLLEAWVVTRHDLVVEALRSGTLRNDRVSINMRAVPAADRARYRGLETHISNWLGFTDPPKHTRMRQVARQILTHEAAQRLRPAAKAMALAELERLSSLRRLDLVEELALDIPLRMICATLGVPEEEAACFHRWSADIAAFAGIVNPDQALLARAIERANESWLEAEEYFARLLELRRSDPRDDGVSVLAAALAAGQLDRDEAIGLCVFVLAAGHGTTAALLGNMAMLLMGDAAQRQALGTGRGLVGRAVEEVLRYESPIPMMSRLAGAELSLAGRRIREGDPVVLQLSAANRDPARFSEPAAFRVEREENRHLAFGSGAHFCLGAPLARAQAGSVL